MKKILFLVLIGLPFYAIAEEEVTNDVVVNEEVVDTTVVEADVTAETEVVSVPAVVSRVVCTDVKAEISELEKVLEPTDEESKHLQELKNQYRAQCGTVSHRRALNMHVDKVATKTEVVEEKTPTPETVATEVPQLTPEQMQEFLNSGLCANGEKPNRYGCCDGEKFTDMGDLKFACCVTGDDGNKTCFDPIK